jgi:F0F1-type ATP synthase epsilon subunit
MAAKSGKFTISVLRETGVIYYGDCEALIVPGKKETIAILAHHTPMIMKLEPGKIDMILDHSRTTLAEVKTGLIYVAEDEVTVLVNL